MMNAIHMIESLFWLPAWWLAGSMAETGDTGGVEG